MGRKARSTLAQSGRLESQKISGGGRSVFLDFSFYRTSRDLARVMTWCEVRGLLPVCRRYILYPAKPHQNARFHWRFTGLSAIAVICRLAPCGALHRRKDKRDRLGIVGLDEVLDLGYQFFDAAEGVAANGLLGDDVEPDFNLIQPGSVGRSEMHLNAGCAASQRCTRECLCVA